MPAGRGAENFDFWSAARGGGGQRGAGSGRLFLKARHATSREKARHAAGEDNAARGWEGCF